MFARRALLRFRLTRPAVILGMVALALTATLPAAEPRLVGILALAAEDDVAEKIGLSQETYQALVTLIDRREAEATPLVLEIRSLPPEEQAKRLAPIVQESERLGLALLSEDQQKKLKQVRIEREGLATLGEPQIAEQLNLTEEQKSQVESLLEERLAALTKGGEAEQRQARIESERRLRGVLSDAQMAAWQKAAGLLEGEQVAQAPAPPEPATPAEPAPEKTPPAPAAKTQPRAAAPPPAASEPLAATSDGGAPDENAQLKFNFRYAPWKDVIEWFAQQANLSLEGEAPLGTFNYTDNRSYTPAEALDLLNSVLLTKGYTLIRRDRLLFVVDMKTFEEGIPPEFVTRVTPEELDERGEYEIVSVLFPITKMTVEQAEAELRPLLGRPGEMVVLPASKQIWVTGTAGRLKTIRKVIQAVDNPESSKDLNKFKVEHVSPEELLAVVRKLMGIPEDANGAEDGSIRFTADPVSSYIYVSGQPDSIKRFEQILKLVDDSESAVSATGPGALEALQLEVYPITDADPTSVLQVMQTLLAGQPGVRLAIDPLTGNLIAMANSADHGTIRATLAQLQRETRQVTVMRLRRLDPQLAVVSINRMFGGGTENPDPKAPIVDADPTSGILLVRGSQTQVSQIKDLLKQMGEDPEVLEGAAAGEAVLGASTPLLQGKVRLLPFTGRSARDLLEQAEMLWPTVGVNRIRIVRPSASIDSRGWTGNGEPSQRGYNGSPPAPSQRAPENSPPAAESPKAAPRASSQPNNREAAAIVPNRSGIRKAVVGRAAQSPSRAAMAADLAEVVVLLNQNKDRADSARDARLRERVAQFAVERHLVAQVEEQDAAPEDANDSEPADPPTPEDSYEGSEIIVRITSSGLIIASNDEEALDKFELLLRELYDTMPAPGLEYTIFYLKYAQASVAADLLTQLVTGVSLDDGGSSGGMMGTIAQAALGNVGGGLVGSLLGGGASSTSTYSSTTFSVVPEPRLNALVIQGTPSQVDTAEQLLTVIDQESSPEVPQITPPPRLIAVHNTSAENVAARVREIYAQQLASGSGQQRQPSPEDFIRALRGGDQGGRGSRGRSEQATQQMTISVDPRSNSLVVAAPEPLFQSVKALVEVLDQPGMESPQTTEVISISGANATTVKSALTAILGDVIKSGTTTSSSSTATTSTSQPSQETPRSSGGDDWRQRIEAFNSMQRGGSGGSPFGGGGSPFGGGFSGRGFGGFGGGFGGDRGGGDRGGGDRGGDRGRGR